MSSSTVSNPPRRSPLSRADRVDSLLAAALEELREHGYEGLTVRNAARRAGIAPATAYVYFSSKGHLVAEAFWRRIQTLPDPDPSQGTPVDRVRAALGAVGLLVAAEPELAAAATTALLVPDPDVAQIVDRLGVWLNGLLAAALGDGAEPVVLRALTLAIGGGLLQAGMGAFSYTELAERMDEVVLLILR